MKQKNNNKAKNHQAAKHNQSRGLKRPDLTNWVYRSTTKGEQCARMILYRFPEQSHAPDVSLFFPPWFTTA